MSSEDSKIFYSIKEVADRINVKPHVLRYWEQEFPDLSPRKNFGGQRTYTRDDILLVERIRNLLYVEKYTIDGARRKLKKNQRTLNYFYEIRHIRDELVALLPPEDAGVGDDE